LNIVVENPIRNPVVFKILGVLAMEPAQISWKLMEQYVAQLLTSAISPKGKK
jgi:phage portal protein BeeE